MTRRHLIGEVLKGREMDYKVFLNKVFSLFIYIRSSPYRPNRDPNRTLSNELLLYIVYKVVYYIEFFLYPS